MLTKHSTIGILLLKLKTLKKKDIILNGIMIALLIMGVVVVFHNYGWYDKTIVKIESAENSLSDAPKGSKSQEKHYSQAITGTIMNGEYQGQKVYLKNNYSSSGLLDDQYKPGNVLFRLPSISRYYGTL